MKRDVLRRLHLGVLAALAASALVVIQVADPADDTGVGAADRRFTLAALGLGLTSVVLRRQAALPSLTPTLRAPFAAAALLAAGAIGAVGVALAWQQDEREASLLYVLGGAILALRPPPGSGQATGMSDGGPAAA